MSLTTISTASAVNTQVIIIIIIIIIINIFV